MSSGGSDAYINDIVDFPELSVLNEKSEIAEFFAHTNILVTGGTGFLGKLLIEKLLRTCPDIVKIYMIIRSKKGKTASQRFKENLEEVVFDKLRHKQPKVLQKVVMLEGDAMLEDYGLSQESKNILMDTNVIFHAAATVRFDEKIRVALNTNVKSTKFLLTFAKSLPNLKAFVHVSTAYAPCIYKTIKEIHYKNNMDADKVLTLLDVLDDEKLQKLTPILLDEWPNTYIFTKLLGENMVLKYSDDLPICIARPSIVTPTYKEPVGGWINNMYGPTGVTMGSATGFLRTLYCVPEYIADIIPADHVTSNIISIAWDIGNRKTAIKSDQVPNLPEETKVPVYNIVSSCQNPISWGDYMKKNEHYAFEIPSEKILWYYMLILNRYLLMHQICVFLLHIVPAAIIDTIAYITGRERILLNAYKKIHKFSNVIHYFATNQWKFHNDNVTKLWKKMNSRDQEIFNFNIASLDWDAYFYVHVRGLRRYLLNDSMDTLDKAQIKFFRLRIAHYTIITVLILLSSWIAVSFTRFVWSFCPLSH